MRRWSCAVAAAVLVVLPAASGCGRTTAHESAVAALVEQADAVATPNLEWTACAGPGLARYECATARVPLDYSRPDGETIDLAVLRQPAGDPDRRLGTLFTAAGGPGRSGFAMAAEGPLFAGELSRRFDVVTFDQRGVGRSAPVRCFVDADERQRSGSTAALVPVTVDQQEEAERAGQMTARGCAADSGVLLPHLTTVDAARDLDLLRRAVGESRLTFQGDDYASYVGVVYGALFSDRVRALQLGSPVDPEPYTRDTRVALADTALGSEEVLGEFFRLCAAAGGSGCAFADPPRGADFARATVAHAPSDPRARHTALLERLRGGPITVGTGERAVAVSYAELVRAHVGLLSDAADGWSDLARILAELDRGADGDAAAVRPILARLAPDLAARDSFTAISCADHTLPDQPGAWPGMASEIDSAAPTFGSYLLYLRLPCASWPIPAGGYQQRYTGPWTLGADKPALLFANRFDPVTPLTSAQRAQQELVNARLVVVSDGYGHDTANECTVNLRERYLVDLRLPAPGATCAADVQPFTS
ncbi:alpha/beta hydrolase [Nocardia arizonensis]|uniref:alpha/beta hydrolase n=1 Tax=Nocardia arizonensis TaxID=1141647 RepID=UPI0006D1D1E8|nr:alpha/beta hydrolase [Nocardia arizonensis]